MMPTKDPVKNVEHIKNSHLKKNEALGAVEYNMINENAEQ